MKALFRIVQGVLGLFDRSSSRGLKGPPDFGDPEAIALRAALQRGQWQAAQAALAAAGEAWDRRNQVVAWAAEWPEQPAWIAAWIAAAGESAEPLLVRGVNGIRLAWAARGGGWGSTVSNAGAQRFIEHLMQAKADLARAAKLAPADPTPWAHLLTVGRGLELDPEQVRAIFEQACRRDPGHYFAHEQMLQYCCPKWFGSREEMWDLVKTRGADAPEGSLLHALVATAHIEHAVDLASEGGSGDAHIRYFETPEVRASLQRAWQCVRSATVGQSPDLLCAMSTFAYALWYSGQLAEAAEALRIVDQRLTGQPWGLEPFPARALRRARKECGVG